MLTQKQPEEIVPILIDYIRVEGEEVEIPTALAFIGFANYDCTIFDCKSLWKMSVCANQA